MGGNAFTNGPDALHTPRMPPDIYELTKSACEYALKKLFRDVQTPIPGPMKPDYGDIDFIVSGPIGNLEGFEHSNSDVLDGSSAADWIAWVLHAVKIIQNSAPFFAAHFAVPWPGQERDFRAVRSRIGRPPPRNRSEAERSLWRTRRDEEINHFLKSFAIQHLQYVQIDVRICNTREELEWLSFKHSHGPFWQIVGPILRPVGLVVDERGFAVMIPRIEPYNKKVARLYLSSKPREAMEALELSYETFVKGPFSSEREMFEFIAQCRFFWVRPPEPLAVKPPADGSAPKELPTKLRQSTSRGQSYLHQCVEPTPTYPKVTDDTQTLPRQQNRPKGGKIAPAVDRWHQEFIPSLRKEGFHRTHPLVSREEVLTEVVVKFRVQDEFDKRMTSFLKEHRTTTITRLVRARFPALDASKVGQNAMMYRGALIKALIRILNHGDKAYGILPPEGFLELEGNELEKRVELFIEENKDVIGEKAMADSEERMRAAMLRKREASGKKGGRAAQEVDAAVDAVSTLHIAGNR